MELSKDEVRVIYNLLQQEYIPHDDDYHLTMQTLAKMRDYLALEDKTI